MSQPDQLRAAARKRARLPLPLLFEKKALLLRQLVMLQQLGHPHLERQPQAAHAAAAIAS